MARQRTVLLSQVASGSGGPSSSTDVAYFDSNGKLTGDSGLTYTAGGGPLTVGSGGFVSGGTIRGTTVIASALSAVTSNIVLTGNLLPTDNTYANGGATNRFSNGFFVLGTIGLATNRATFGEQLFVGATGNASIGTESTANTSDIYLKRANGTPAARTIVANGNSIGSLHALGWNGTGYDGLAEIEFSVDGVPGASGDMPGAIKFYTTPNGSATEVLALTIDSARNIRTGAATVGTNGVGVVCIASGTAPASAPADQVQIYSSDISAGNCALSWYQEIAPYGGIAVASTTKVPVIVNGTTLYLLATTVA